jgi:deazaflavin-dependent oxidoreductase (nitroreductase family)
MTTHTVDITTTGRRSGQPRTIEIWTHERDGRTFITGRPGRRDWYANLLADPRLTVDGRAATARPITSEAERRALLAPIAEEHAGAERVAAWLAGAPLVEVAFD